MIGGTVFVGRYIVQALLDVGHEVTLFHRGKSGANAFPDCPRILGDRIEDIAKAADTHWDAIVDSSAYFPRQLRALGEALAHKTDFFTFVSTISVYDFQGDGPFDETTPLLPIGDPETEVVTGETYGYLKILCEQEAEKWFSNRLAIVRPGIVFGPHDPTGRFPYWVSRGSSEPKILVPDALDQTVQWIDTRDLGNFTAKLTSEKTIGTWNAVGPQASFGKLLESIQSISGNDPKKVIVPLDKLAEGGIRPWVDLPLVHAGDPSRNGVFNFSNEKAKQCGLTLRSLDETTSATLNWLKTEPVGPAKYGMTREEELNAISRLES